VGVDETKRGGSVVGAGVRVEDDSLVAGRRADGCDPLLPFVRVLRFLIGA